MYFILNNKQNIQYNCFKKEIILKIVKIYMSVRTINKFDFILKKFRKSLEKLKKIRIVLNYKKISEQIEKKLVCSEKDNERLRTK